MTSNLEHSSHFRVYTEDTDYMGIVYHANYLYFFERARSEMLRDFGLSLTTMANHGTHFAIHDISIRYYYPAKLDDMLAIKTNCDVSRGCILEFKQVMHNQLDKKLSDVLVKVVCVDENLKPKRLPASLGFTMR